MTDLMDFYWYGALRHWFHSGSHDVIIDALQRNIPMKPNEARFLAAIMAGKVRPWGTGGGRSYRERAGLYLIKADIVVPLFERALNVAKWHAKRHTKRYVKKHAMPRRSQHAVLNVDPRALAYRWVAKQFHGRFKASTIATIVDQRSKWNKGAISDKAAREFQTLYAIYQ